MPQHEDDAELRDLWARRANLDEAEWTRLYGIVNKTLKPYRPQILSSLSSEPDVYVQEFFEDKVYRRDLLSRLDHVGALRVAYRRYLLDHYDSEKIRRTEQLTNEDPDEQVTRATTGAEPNGASDNQNESDALSNVGISFQQLGESAARWLRDGEPWIREYLGFSYCPDPESAEPLDRLRRRRGIASHHYKAEKLGITGIFDQAYGENKLIGRWLTKELGIAITKENQPLVLAALKILCFEALTWAEGQEAAP